MTRAHRALAVLGSPRLTPLALLTLAAGLGVSHAARGSSWWTVLPLVVLALNLCACLLVDARLRLRAPLLVFHVALLAVMLLAVAGELLRFSGRVTVVEGTRVDVGAVTTDARGPLHDAAWLESLRFVQGRFSTEYHPGLRPGRTRSVVHTGDGAEVEVGSTRPWTENGYRFHTTANKGFAALVEWQDTTGARELGALLFPSWPREDWRQRVEWRTPAGTELAVELLVPLRVSGREAFVLDSDTARGGLALVLEHAGGRALGRLAVGGSLDLPGGRLRLVETRLWVGYRVSFDPLLPWLLAAGLVGAAALAVHFGQRFRRADGRAVAVATSHA